MAHDERKLDQAIARHLRADGARAAEGVFCPDAEILAAYHQRSLSPQELTDWKTHIAGCARCQEILSLLETTEGIPAREEKDSVLVMPAADFAAAAYSARKMASPAALTAVGSAGEIKPKIKDPNPDRGRATKWSMLLVSGAIAASLVAWIALHQTLPHPANNTSVQIAANRPAASSPPVPAERSDAAKPNELTDKVPRSVKTPAAAAESSAGAGRSAPTAVAGLRDREGTPPVRSQLSELKSQMNARAAAGPQSATGQATGQLTAKDEKADQLQKTQEEIITATAAPPPPSESAAFGRAAARPAPPKAAPAPQTEKQGQDAATAAKKKEADVEVGTTSQMVEVTPGDTVLGYSASNLLNSNTIADPHNKTVWRVGTAGSIVRVSDAGATTTQKSGTKADLLGGIAISAKVVWIVGRAGTVLRTTDGGEHWIKLQAPTPDDLVRIQANDAFRATVVDVKKQSYQTTDGGSTWRLAEP